MIKPFFDFLATELTLTKGTTFHMGHIPANAADNCTGLLNRAGASVDAYNPNQYWFRFQFLTRNTSYADGDTEAFRVFSTAVKLRGEQLTGWYLFDVTGNAPAYIGTDEKGRHEFSSNVTVSARKE